MSVALLDVNILVSLFDPAHPHFEDAHAWFGSLRGQRWATCPITENGCIRILSSPRHPSAIATPAEIARLLQIMSAKPNHEFWPEDISLLDEPRFHLSKIGGPKQITDVYLLALAVARGGQLVTFDRSIPWRAVVGATQANLRILGG
jgi:toxin-antitoxin system PIN domain toxin